MASLDDEAQELTELLRGKIVKTITRRRPKEVSFEFDDGTCLFVDRTDDGLEFFVTSGVDDDE